MDSCLTACNIDSGNCILPPWPIVKSIDYFTNFLCNEQVLHVPDSNFDRWVYYIHDC